ncbi:trypsin-like peptidase domain-containing protein [Paenibacillus sp. N3/727]|uniref:S1C family serine protease n=1 Tax=Paenibacillus sp. N3/727 TaxID=2925845 RepID=UPI001F53763B|nr:trypsin-like peptidase domain-containing protein [Paenibacillus sp. N3/727]UNK17412.1 trypsin-like peptidase domain-containing protein [Paenibacillus sp. N3/727]
MDDQRNRFGQNDEEQTNEPQERLDQSSDNSSYYYSYGPFKSISGEDDRNEGHDSYGRREPQEVEITAPQPVRPVPSPSYSAGASGQGDGGGNGRGGSLPEKTSSGQWNFNHKPKSSVKTVLLSFLAGMLVITGLMFAADRANLFTPEAALMSQAAGNENVKSALAPADENSASTASAQIPSNPGDVASVVDEASPAVVLIETLVKSNGQRQNNSNMDDPLFRYFFGDQSNQGSNGSNEGSSNESSQLQPSGIGSGFIFDKSGYILTNEHVVHGADVIQVTLQDNKKPYEAKLLGSSYELDLAVLKIEGDGDFPAVNLGDSDDLKVGEWLVAIGNPHGFEHTVTAGVLSSKERDIDISGQNGEKDRNYEHLLQTDASINPGNSGGPLLNLKGEVIGMNVAVSAEAQGIGFAIPSKTISEVLDYLKNDKEVPKTPIPFIGARLGTLTPQVSQQLGTDVTEGSYVDSIVFRSPAYEADLRQYDIVTGADGTKYATSQDLIEFIQSKKVGDKITLNVVRNGKKLDLPLMIGDRNEFETSQQQQP